jgi:fructosamine-3-kinase
VRDRGEPPAAVPFVKRRPDAPEGFFATEAAGLAWLREAVPAGGVPVVEVLEAGRHHLTLRRLHPGAASPAAAEDFGRRLAVTHAAGAPFHGAAAPGAGGRGWIGPLPMPVHDAPPDGDRRWGPFFAAERLEPYLGRARDRGALDADGAAAVGRVCDGLAAGDPDLTGPEEPVARLHGDLWSGNVVWTPDGAVLVDPAAHGGHRESDLAMLALFGAPYLDRALAAYQEVRPLAAGWRRRVGVHQLFPLLVHAALFGAGYGREAADVARRLRG